MFTFLFLKKKPTNWVSSGHILKYTVYADVCERHMYNMIMIIIIFCTFRLFRLSIIETALAVQRSRLYRVRNHGSFMWFDKQSTHNYL